MNFLHLIGLLTLAAGGQATTEAEKIAQINTRRAQALTETLVGARYPGEILPMPTMGPADSFAVILFFSIQRPDNSLIPAGEHYYLLRDNKYGSEQDQHDNRQKILDSQWLRVDVSGVETEASASFISLREGEACSYHAFILDSDATVVKTVSGSMIHQPQCSSLGYQIRLYSGDQPFFSSPFFKQGPSDSDPQVMEFSVAGQDAEDIPKE